MTEMEALRQEVADLRKMVLALQSEQRRRIHVYPTAAPFPPPATWEVICGVPSL